MWSREYNALSIYTYLKFKAFMGRGSNNFAELMELKLSLLMDSEKGAQMIQVFGDSLVVINKKEGSFSCDNFILCSIFEDIKVIISIFNSTSLQCIYKEMNIQANALSKEGLVLALGCWNIWDEQDGHCFNYLHVPIF
jgi:hypothetical protein